VNIILDNYRAWYHTFQSFVGRKFRATILQFKNLLLSQSMAGPMAIFFFSPLWWAFILTLISSKETPPCSYHGWIEKLQTNVALKTCEKKLEQNTKIWE
jgi:hypothetical protein